MHAKIGALLLNESHSGSFDALSVYVFGDARAITAGVCDKIHSETSVQIDCLALAPTLFPAAGTIIIS